MNDNRTILEDIFPFLRSIGANLAIITGVCYFFGFIVVNCDLLNNGFFIIEFFRPRYFCAGICFLILILPPIFFGILCAKISSNESHRNELLAFWILRIILCCIISILCQVLLFMYLLDNAADNFSIRSVFEALGLAFDTVPSVYILALIFPTLCGRASLLSRHRKISKSILEFDKKIDEGSLCNSCSKKETCDAKLSESEIKKLTLDIKARHKRAKKSQQRIATLLHFHAPTLLFAFSILVIFSSLLGFSLNIYPRIEPGLGGGRPIPMELGISEENCKQLTAFFPELQNRNSLSVSMLDTTDEYYLFLTGDNPHSRAAILEKTMVQILFSSPKKSK